MTATASDSTISSRMRAAVRRTYGEPDVVRVEEVEKPALLDDGVLVRVHSASLNLGDWYTLRGKPAWMRPMIGGVRRPKSPYLGMDFAGTVEAVGKDVSGAEPGDEIFGGKSGAFADYICARNHAVALKPPNVTFEEAAAVPVAALTALQGLRDHGKVEAGWKVLVNGASGGVGTFAVQIAKALGAHVTAVCSTRNVELVRSLGADDVVDYRRDDFTRRGRRYDVLLDIAGSRSWSEMKGVLEPEGTVVLIGAPNKRVLGPIGHIVGVRIAAIGASQKAVNFIAKFNKADMNTLRELLEAGKIKPVVERRYELSEVPDALRYLGEVHPQGKLVVTVAG